MEFGSITDLSKAIPGPYLVIIALLASCAVCGACVGIYISTRIAMDAWKESRAKRPLRKAYIEGHLRTRSSRRS
jgi:hypothetical protein